MHIAPLNYAIDFTNKKRFSYGKSIYLNSQDSIRTIEPPVRKRWNEYFAQKYERNKNDYNFFVSVPYINSFNYKPATLNRKISTGFWGIGAGAEYFYRSKKFVSVKTSIATNFFSPIPAAVTLDTVRESLNGIYFDLTDNFKLGRLSLGYGLNYGLNTWRHINASDRNNTIINTKINRNLGLTLNASFQFNRLLYMGVIYRPAILQLSAKPNLYYEHLVSVDVAVKFPKPRKRR